MMEPKEPDTQENNLSIILCFCMVISGLIALLVIENYTLDLSEGQPSGAISGMFALLIFISKVFIVFGFLYGLANAHNKGDAQNIVLKTVFIFCFFIVLSALMPTLLWNT